MRADFKEFRYCDGDWKVKAFATEYYPTWFRKRPNAARVKGEELTDTKDIKNKNRKRSSVNVEHGSSKKRKLLSVNGSPSDSTNGLDDNDDEDFPAKSPCPQLSAPKLKGKQRAVEHYDDL
jgi:hypothetical protein